MNSQFGPNNSPLEILYVNSKKVFCQGGKEGDPSNSGHPLVYLDMGENDNVVCPYCSRFFTIKKKHIKTKD